MSATAQTAPGAAAQRSPRRTSAERLVTADRKPAPRYFIILQSSSDPGVALRASIPADLQNSEVFTFNRTSERVTLYDFNLGYFATLEDAEHAQRILLRRFPDASIVLARPAESQKPSGLSGR